MSIPCDHNRTGSRGAKPSDNSVIGGNNCRENCHGCNFQLIAPSEVRTLEGDAVGRINFDRNGFPVLKSERKQAATLTQMLLSAYCILLHRYSGRMTVLVGLATSTRTDGRSKDVVGDFVDPVAIRNECSGYFFAELSKRCGTQFLAHH